MLNNLKYIFEIGVDENLLRSEKVKIKLHNTIIFVWILFSVIFVICDIIAYIITKSAFPYLINIGLHFFNIILISLIFWLQYKAKYNLARILTLSTLFIVYFLFANVLEAGKFMEFFFVVVPVFSLLFFESKWIHLLWLGLSFLAFQIPMYVFDWYPSSEINPLTNFIIFIASFICTSYFKKLYQKNEKLLENEKQQAEKDKKLIEMQKIELEELNNFKNKFFVNISHELRTPLLPL